MTARSQGHPILQTQASSTQHLRERQRFFEDVLAHEVDKYYPHTHLLSERWRPPLDSVSSMEVNIDSLELSEPLDINELEASDAFQQSDEPISPFVCPADLQGMDYFRLRFPFSPTSDQQHLVHDGDSTVSQEEAAHVQTKERNITPDPPHNDHKPLARQHTPLRTGQHSTAQPPIANSWTDITAPWKEHNTQARKWR